MQHRPLILCTLFPMAAGAAFFAPAAHADNQRLNNGVVANVYTVQHQAGCTNDVTISPPLRLAAQWHTLDVLTNRNIDGDTGSDGSTPQGRANAAGYHGTVTETVAINPAIAISGIELMNQWHDNPADFAIMSNCNSQMGVWSENSPDRTVVVAVYGNPDRPQSPQPAPQGPPPVVAMQQNIPLDPSPDYDASDEVEFGLNWLPWILRGVYPPPAIPPQ
jgi:hypothetical protein